jgi:hypothetical protein
VQKLWAVARKRSVSESVTGYQLKLGTTMKYYKQVISWDGTEIFEKSSHPMGRKFFFIVFHGMEFR